MNQEWVQSREMPAE